MDDVHSISQVKTCSTCKVEKPVDQFSKKARKPDGLNGQCKACCQASWKRYYAKHTEELLERAKAYRLANPLDKDLAAKRSQAYRTKNKDAISLRRKAKYAVDARLREQNVSRAKEWYQRNKERQSKFQSDYYKQNRQRIMERVRAYKEANPEQEKAWSRVKANKRRARLAEGPQYTPDDVKKILALQKHKCANCHKSLKDGYHIDHKIPVAKGGTNDPRNIELLCPTCNLRKSAKLPHEFAQENGRLL